MNSNILQIITFQTFIWIIKPIIAIGLAIVYYFTWFTINFTDLLLSIFVRECESSHKNFLNKIRKQLNTLRPYPGVYTSATDMITDMGYNLEIHKVLTEDGYILTAWRIYKQGAVKRHSFPIILQHGLLDSSWSWFINNSKQQTLPYILADQGYDVWCTNNRGNKYSIGHSKLLGVDYNKNYWNFTFDDLAQYDFKAIINHILTATQMNKVIYIGHSQGSTQAFAYLSNHPEFQELISCFIALGPALYIKSSTSLFLRFAVKTNFFSFVETLGIPYFFVFDDSLNLKIGALCDMIPWIYKRLLFWITNLICGYPLKNKIDLNKFGFMVAHEPGGTSTRTIQQWMQFYKTGQFSYYDYGSRLNRVKYGQTIPPKYEVNNLQQITIPKYFYIGTKDVIADEKDLNRTIPLFDAHTLNVTMIDDYAHLDYIWGTDAYLKLYPLLIKDIEKHQNI